MKRVKLTKQEQLHHEHLEYNRQMKQLKISPVSFEEWINIIHGKVKVSTNYKKSAKIVSIPVWAVTNSHVPSVTTNTQAKLSKNSIMEQARRGTESKEVTDEIIRKSKRIGIMYNKGGYEYISDGTDPKTLGKKSQQL